MSAETLEPWHRGFCSPWNLERPPVLLPAMLTHGYRFASSLALSQLTGTLLNCTALLNAENLVLLTPQVLKEKVLFPLHLFSGKKYVGQITPLHIGS